MNFKKKLNQEQQIKIIELLEQIFSREVKTRFSRNATKNLDLVETLLSNVKTKRKIVPNFCGLLKIHEL